MFLVLYLAHHRKAISKLIHQTAFCPSSSSPCTCPSGALFLAYICQVTSFFQISRSVVGQSSPSIFSSPCSQCGHNSLTSGSPNTSPFFWSRLHTAFCAERRQGKGQVLETLIWKPLHRHCIFVNHKSSPLTHPAQQLAVPCRVQQQLHLHITEM